MNHLKLSTMPPTGGNDTDLIQDALNNAAPGDVIFLEEGTFLIDPIYVEDFVGTFKGARMDKTFFEPIGAPGTWNGYNLINAYYIESNLTDPWQVSGNHAIWSCYFSSASWAASFGPFGDVNLEVGGSPNKANVFENIYAGIEVYDVSNSQVEVSNLVYKHNKVLNVGGTADGAF